MAKSELQKRAERASSVFPKSARRTLAKNLDEQEAETLQQRQTEQAPRDELDVRDNVRDEPRFQKAQ